MHRVRMDLIECLRKDLLTGVLAVSFGLTICLGGRSAWLLGSYAYWGDLWGNFHWK